MTYHPQANLDTAFYAVLVDHTLRLGTSWVERNLRDSRADIIRDITRGEYHRVLSVIEFNPGEGWSRDISSEIATEVYNAHTSGAAWSDCALNFVESTLRTFIRRAA